MFGNCYRERYTSTVSHCRYMYIVVTRLPGRVCMGARGERGDDTNGNVESG